MCRRDLPKIFFLPIQGRFIKVLICVVEKLQKRKWRVLRIIFLTYAI